MEETKTKKREFTGVVVSDKMDKTIVVSVERILPHKIYKKLVKENTSYKVHDEKNEAKVGNKVRFVQCRPLSKDKRNKLVDIIS